MLEIVGHYSLANNEVLAVIGVRVSNYFSEEKRSNDDMVLIIEKATS